MTALQLLTAKQTAISFGKGMTLGVAWLGAITIDEHALLPVGSVAVIVALVIRYTAIVQKFRDRIDVMERELREIKKRNDRRDRDDDDI